MKPTRFLAAIGCVLALGAANPAWAQTDPLADGFRNPPESAKPRAWWQWMNGNVTEEGIKLDLAWMKRVGFGGVTMFDAAIAIPPLIPNRLAYGSEGWKSALRLAGSEAVRLGLDITIVGSPGWSESGGPWVKPEEAMKKIVWAETRFKGPGRLREPLKAPPGNSGPFQNIQAVPSVVQLPITVPDALPEPNFTPQPIPNLYRDVKVLAWRAPAGDVAAQALKPTVTSNSGKLDYSALVDGDMTNNQQLAGAEPGKPVWIQFEYPQPQTISAAFLRIGGGGRFGTTSIPEGRFESSTDASTWRVLAALPGPYATSAPTRTFAFPATTARYFRFTFTNVPPNPMSIFGAPPFRHYDIAELRLDPGARINRFEEKAGYGVLHEYDTIATPEIASAATIPVQGVIDLTDKLLPDGRLDWSAPTGDWVILRIGASLTGKQNAPAAAEARGLEADKFSRKHMTSYLEGYFGPLLKILGDNVGDRGFRHVLTDSWEADQANWTDDMFEQFRTRRGYDPTPYLPALAGRVVGDAETSDRFLWDYRRTMADLIAENHYGTIRDFLHARGLDLFGEATGVKLHTTSDGLQAKSYTDAPMGEFWLVPFGGTPNPEHISDVREAASAAHIYGKKIVAAEAFTVFPVVQDPWAISPWNVKWIADRYLALGVNQFQISTAVHQPFVDRKPGITLGPFGQHFTRNHTWAELAGPWVNYLTRSSYMLQQGRSVADVAYFYGEGAAVSAPYGVQLRPEIPEGYAYDYVGADAIMRLMSVENGRIVLPSGQSYRILVLPEALDVMTLPVLRKIGKLVEDGAVVVGPKPRRSPSLADDAAAVRAEADRIWGAADGRSVTSSPLGRGRVFWGLPPATILAALGEQPDVVYTRPSLTTKLHWAHRRTADAEIYFVANYTPRAEKIEVEFKIDGREAEFWRPDTASIEPASYVIRSGRTIVPVAFDPYGSTFVVFRRPAQSPERSIAEPRRQAVATVGEGWKLAFPENWGAPPAIELGALQSWTDNAEAGVRHFSGTATYTKTIDAPRAWFTKGARIEFDLGQVRDIAEVSVNGKPLGVYWKPPFKVDVTDGLKPGRNTLEIRVTNNWTNRLIGDDQAPAGTKRYTYTTGSPYPPGAKLVPSGLLGPVTVSTLTPQ